MKKLTRALVGALGVALVAPHSAHALGTWSSFNAPVGLNPLVTMLLTDGSVLIAEDFHSAEWWILKPDANGNYSTGTFTKKANGPVQRLYYGHAVLADGRVLTTGGEYINGSAVWSNRCDIYDPTTNIWTNLTPPAGWTRIGDPPHAVLEDGRFFLGNAIDNKTSFFNPATNTFSPGPNKLDSGSEEGWALMHDGTLINPMGVSSPNAEKYDPAQNKWIAAGTLPVPIFEASSREPGAGLSLYDGRVWESGGTGFSVIYNMPSAPALPGSWTQGPTFPMIAGKQTGAKDGMVAILPNGKVMAVVSPVDGVAGNFLSPTYWFEYDPNTNLLTQVPSPAISNGPCYTARLVMLPNGQMMYTQGINTIFLYTPDGGPQTSWRSAVSYSPKVLTPGSSVTVLGTQLNGLTQGANYGDEGVPATNYPVIRLRQQGGSNVYFCRTTNHSTMGIRPGSTVHWTTCAIPTTVPAGNYDMEVTANGVSSAGYSVKVGATATKFKGTLNLDAGYLGRYANVPLSYELRTPGSGAVVQSGTFHVTNSGAYEISTDLAGTVDLFVRGSHWLWKASTGRVLDNTTQTINLTILNGDCDGSNTVTTDDYFILSLAFGLDLGDAGYDARADLDGNDSITTDDYLILSGNFDLSGDES